MSYQASDWRTFALAHFLLLVCLTLYCHGNQAGSFIKTKSQKKMMPTSHMLNENHIAEQTSQINETELAENCSRYNWSREHGCTLSGLLNYLLANYDKRLRPFMEVQRPVTVTIGFWILSIDSINVIDMDYQIDFFFRQAWVDPRLKHSYPTELTISNTMLEKIWLPDTYFENSKGSHFHDVTVPNKMLRIKPEGTIMYNARISVKASCPMDLRMFPMDVQECELNIESYGYSTRDIIFQWENNTKRIAIGNKVRTLPQYNLTGFRTVEKWTEYVVGNWSGLTAIFVLERRTGYFFLHLYAPCALIVMISWISFCIPKESTAARVALGITSVLTITTILNMLNTSMPKVSYIKAVDWYLIVSFLFVFAVLIEYTLVLYLTDKEKQTERRKKKAKERKERRRIKEVQRRQSCVDVVANGDCHELRSRLPSTYAKDILYETNVDTNVRREVSNNGKPVVVIYDGKGCNTDFDEGKEKLKGSIGRILCQFRVDAIDEYSRMIFPISFATFNLVYWVLFFNKKTKD